MELDEFTPTRAELDPSIRRSPEPDLRTSTTAAFARDPELVLEPTLTLRDTDSAVRGRFFAPESSESPLVCKIRILYDQARPNSVAITELIFKCLSRPGKKWISGS